MASACSANPNYTAMMTYLLDLGLDINELDNKQDHLGKGTHLHYAVFHRVREAARFLLEKGADPHKKNQWGFSAVEYAAKWDVMYLLQEGDEITSSHALHINISL
jgi:ankyrin repeat protein